MQAHIYLQDVVKPHSASLICFNLGYLPSAEDKSRTATQQHTTVAAVAAALNVVNSRGLISIMAYIGHAGKLPNITRASCVTSHAMPAVCALLGVAGYEGCTCFRRRTLPSLCNQSILCFCLQEVRRSMKQSGSDWKICHQPNGLSVNISISIGRLHLCSCAWPQRTPCPNRCPMPT